MVGHGTRNRHSNSTPDDEAKAQSRRRRKQEPDEADAASHKRRRVTRACDQCRQGREKCDGSRPCHACQTADRQCTYKGESKRRGVQPGYIRALEALLAWTVTHINGADAELRELLAREPVTEELGISSKETSTSEHLANAWVHCQVHQDLDQLLTSKAASHEADHPLEGETHKPDGYHTAGDGTHQPSEDIEMSYADRTLPSTIAGFGSDAMPSVLAQTYGLNLDSQGESTLDSMISFQPGYTRAIEPDIASILDLPVQSLPSTVGYGGFDFFSEQAVPYSQSSPNTLDAFLDELASAEFTEIADQQPQFMQNLGLGPEFNPSEMMNDAGEWLIP